MTRSTRLPLRTRWRTALASTCLTLMGVGCSRPVPLVTEPVPPARTAPIPISQTIQAHNRFGSLFCGVLAHLGDVGQWGYCATYIEPAGTPADVSKPIPKTYRVLVVPGIFGQCIEALARPFEDGARHLRNVHGISVEYVSVSATGSCAYNAKQIADYLAVQPAGPPYIAFGYSKGASDLLEAMATQDIARRRIAAIVTIAGSVLGSRLTQGVPRGMLDFLKDTRLASCDVGDGGGIESLRRAQRVAAMARFVPPDGFRSYSIAAVSNLSTTSKVLEDGWRALQPFTLEQDSQMLHEDAIVPGGTYLGIAKGDHWAVALPFEDVPSSNPAAPIIAASVNHNHYPRVALFEAALRFSIEDLSSR